MSNADILNHWGINGSIGKKAMTNLDILDTIRDMQRHGKKIALVNGCYDLFHPGHVYFLMQAALHCDHLVVGLNSDESVRALNKAPGQPYFEYDLRLLMLEQIEAVGSVLEFDGDVYALIDAVNPDVIIRGAGQHLSETEKAMEARADGSLVWITPRVWSTSQTVAAILKAHHEHR